MPDADIPPVVLSDEEIARIQAEVPMLPGEYREKLSVLSVDKSVVYTIMNFKPYADAVLSALDSRGASAARRIANWFASVNTTETVEWGDYDAIDVSDMMPNVEGLIKLSDLVDHGELSSTAAKEVFGAVILNRTDDPREFAEKEHLLQVSDEGAIAAIVDEVLSDPTSAASIADIKAGKDKAIGYLVGQVMKRSKGQANPSLAQKLIREKL